MSFLSLLGRLSAQSTGQYIFYAFEVPSKCSIIDGKTEFTTHLVRVKIVAAKGIMRATGSDPNIVEEPGLADGCAIFRRA